MPKVKTGQSHQTQPVVTRTTEQVEVAVLPTSFFVPQPGPDSTRVPGFKLEAGYLRGVQRLIESGYFDWATQTDYLRWAAINGLEQVHRLLGEVDFNNELTVLRGMMQRVQQLRRERLWAEAGEELTKELRQMIRDGARADARKEWGRLHEAAKSIVASVYRERLVGVLEDGFPEFSGVGTGKKGRGK